MSSSKIRLWVCLGVLAVGGLVAFLGVLALQGYLFPVRYYEYFPNGRVSVEGYTLRHTPQIWLKEGKSTCYYPDGKKVSEGIYHEGVAVGTWTHWNRDGSIKQVEECDKLGTKTRTEYQNGVPKLVYDRDKEPPHYWSATHFDDDHVKNNEIKTAIDLKVQHGATPADAEFSVREELKLHKQAARQSSSPTSVPH